MFKTSTFPDGTTHVNSHIFKGTFVFDATDPAAADFIATEQPQSTQVKLDADGNGSVTIVGGFHATGTDGSRILSRLLLHFDIVGFTTVIPTLDHSTFRCI